MNEKLDDNWIPLGVAVRAAIFHIGDVTNINCRHGQSDMNATDPIADMFLEAWGWGSAAECRRLADARDRIGGPVTQAQEAVANAAKSSKQKSRQQNDHLSGPIPTHAPAQIMVAALQR